MKNQYKKHKSHIIYTIKLRNKKFLIIMMLIIFNTTFLFAFKKIETELKDNSNTKLIVESVKNIIKDTK